MSCEALMLSPRFSLTCHPDVHCCCHNPDHDDDDEVSGVTAKHQNYFKYLENHVWISWVMTHLSCQSFSFYGEDMPCSPTFHCCIAVTAVHFINRMLLPTPPPQFCTFLNVFLNFCCLHRYGHILHWNKSWDFASIFEDSFHQPAPIWCLLWFPFLVHERNKNYQLGSRVSLSTSLNSDMVPPYSSNVLMNDRGHLSFGWAHLSAFMHSIQIKQRWHMPRRTHFLGTGNLGSSFPWFWISCFLQYFKVLQWYNWHAYNHPSSTFHKNQLWLICPRVDNFI